MSTARIHRLIELPFEGRPDRVGQGPVAPVAWIVVSEKQAIALDSGNDSKQLDIARHTLAAAQRRLAQVPQLRGKCDGF